MKGPQKVVARLDSQNRISLTWDSVPGASSYKIYETASPAGVKNGIIIGTSSVRGPFNIYRRYGYWVTAFVEGVETEPSNTQYFDYKPLGTTKQHTNKVIDWKDVRWAADFSKGENNTECKFTKTQTQKTKREKIITSRSVIPVVNHSILGKALEFELPDKNMRLECNPTGDNKFHEDITYHSFAFVIDEKFPRDAKEWQVIWQLHGNDNVSPKFSLQLRNKELHIGDLRGNWSPEIFPNSKYRIIILANKKLGLISVWVNGNWALENFVCGKSLLPYYQKYGWYHHDSLPGGKMWQNGHAIGSTFESVKQFL